MSCKNTFLPRHLQKAVLSAPPQKKRTPAIWGLPPVEDNPRCLGPALPVLVEEAEGLAKVFVFLSKESPAQRRGLIEASNKGRQRPETHRRSERRKKEHEKVGCVEGRRL